MPSPSLTGRKTTSPKSQRLDRVKQEKMKRFAVREHRKRTAAWQPLLMIRHSAFF
tara:strand:+ start:884 stop:1048 length:165 start_codon:yes stop_codon:yes gene_type:complete